MEQTNLATYDAIAQEFSQTRAYVWKCVKDFLPRIAGNGRIGLEIGCGNGKNMEYVRTHVTEAIVGVDTCVPFLEICDGKGLHTVQAHSNRLPFSDEQFDFTLCIAMFHHLLTDQDRNQTMGEILRVMNVGALGILTCWSTFQPEGSRVRFHEGVNEVPWVGKRGKRGSPKMRYYYVYSESMFREYFQSFVERLKIVAVYNEFGNWVLVFQRIGSRM